MLPMAFKKKEYALHRPRREKALGWTGPKPNAADGDVPRDSYRAIRFGARPRPFALDTEQVLQRDCT